MSHFPALGAQGARRELISIARKPFSAIFRHWPPRGAPRVNFYRQEAILSHCPALGAQGPAASKFKRQEAILSHFLALGAQGPAASYFILPESHFKPFSGIGRLRSFPSKPSQIAVGALVQSKTFSNSCGCARVFQNLRKQRWLCLCCARPGL